VFTFSFNYIVKGQKVLEEIKICNKEELQALNDILLYLKVLTIRSNNSFDLDLQDDEIPLLKEIISEYIKALDFHSEFMEYEYKPEKMKFCKELLSKLNDN